MLTLTLTLTLDLFQQPQSRCLMRYEDCRAWAYSQNTVGTVLLTWFWVPYAVFSFKYGVAGVLQCQTREETCTTYIHTYIHLWGIQISLKNFLINPQILHLQPLCVWCILLYDSNICPDCMLPLAASHPWPKRVLCDSEQDCLLLVKHWSNIIRTRLNIRKNTAVRRDRIFALKFMTIFTGILPK